MHACAGAERVWLHHFVLEAAHRIWCTVGGRCMRVRAQSVSGLVAVLESGKPLNGRWYDFKGEEIPW